MINISFLITQLLCGFDRFTSSLINLTLTQQQKLFFYLRIGLSGSILLNLRWCGAPSQIKLDVKGEKKKEKVRNHVGVFFVCFVLSS